MNTIPPTNNDFVYNYKLLPNRDDVLGRRTRGRPKGSQNIKTILPRMLANKHTSKENGDIHTVLQLIILTLRRKTIEGDVAAMKLYEKYFEKFIDPMGKNSGEGVFLAPEGMTAEEYIAYANAENARKARIMQEVKNELGMN